MKKAIMWIVNYLKVGLAWLLDFVNWAYDPFKEFTRPDDIKYAERLNEKEAKFSMDMERFWWPARKVYLYTLPGNSGDQCLHHGIYTAMTACKYAVTKDEITLSKLKDCALGLRMHQVSDSGDEIRLIRGWRSDATYEDNVSNDQASGHVLGIYFLWKYGDILSRNMSRGLIVGLANELLAHDNCFVNADETPTPFGKLVDGYLTDPLNLTLCLVIYKLAHEMTDDVRYEVAYNDILSLYKPLIPYANLKLWWWKQDSCAVRAAIHYTILCDLEKDHDTQRMYLRGLLRTWRMERKTANPLVYFLMRRICLYDPAYEDRIRRHLREMTLEDKGSNIERINSTRAGVESFKWGNYLRSRQPLALWRMGAQDSFWLRNLSSVDDWVGNKVPDTQYNGGDFLIAYWGLRSLGIIGSAE